ncbi:hypothetical protein Vretimale_19517 [Volvox reticuliferus]|nr:hypothetical protein Vretifemale_6090 [Volvox reticuliferus]GIM16950.1 hypothetical protein Vretimale_19517 [Volvox reticuliferus]
MTRLQPLEAALDPDEAVALGAAVQAGILQGEISNLMVMDQRQASLMRALAKMQLQSDPRVKQRLEQQYSLEDEGESVVNGDEYGDGGGDEDRVEGDSRTGGRKPAAAAAAGPKRLVSKRQRRRQQQQQQRRQREGARKGG